MSKKTKIAVIVGASGLVGSHLLKILLESDTYTNVIAVGRSSLNIDHPKLEEKIINFTNISNELKDVFCTHAYITIGTTIHKAKTKKNFKQVDLEYPYEIATALHTNGCKKLAIISALGASTESSFFYNRIKGKMEDKISGIPFKSLYIFRPSLLLGDRTEFRLGEKVGEVANKIFKHVMLGKLSKFKGIEASHVALVMHHMIVNGKKGMFVLKSDLIRKTALEISKNGI